MEMVSGVSQGSVQRATPSRSDLLRHGYVGWPKPIAGRRAFGPSSARSYFHLSRACVSLSRASTQSTPSPVVSFFQNGASVFR